ncbi:MAG: metallophosphoesterase family protein [Planctomycetes bacterium]|nr:metallophosphoesterase family protein [Planctomycetota bacterium]
MFAVISDLHSNIAALEVVLQDIESLGVTDIICLGDVVGYGPQPLECVDMVMEKARVCLKGNHDEALVHGAYAFNLRAQKAIEWTRDQLKPGFFSGAAVRRRWEFLTNLPLRHEEGPDLFIHGSPRDPTNEYILATEIGFGPTEKFEEIFASFERFLFVGHTHMPCIITDKYETKTSTELNNVYEFPDMAEHKVIINVGSVGQPRDRDNRACYVIVDGSTVKWRRCEYNIERTTKVMDSIAQLDQALSARLKEGI